VPTRDSATGEMISGFAKSFAKQRQAELPPWAPREAFDHFYRLTLNTSLDPAAEGPRQIRVGDELRTDVALSAPGSAGGSVTQDDACRHGGRPPGGARG
jgi:hypothetical protein